MFARANMDEQRHRLMETLGILIAELHDPGQLVVDLVAYQAIASVMRRVTTVTTGQHRTAT